MAFVHGKDCDVLVDEFDLTGYLNQANITTNMQTVDVTPFGADDHQYLAGLEGGTISLGGMFDATATVGSDAVLDAALDSSNHMVTIGFPGVDTVGNNCALANSRQVEYQVRAPVNDAVRITANIQADGAIRVGGVLLHDLSAETGAVDETSVDNGALTSYGAVANLHVTAFTGTDATVTITDSTDDNTFAELIPFTQVTGVGAEHATVTGTVNRYVRVELTGTFDTITFAVSFARNTR
jgi:hypothetical protein